ncbi:potassium channel family protein [Hydrogenimonas sp.]
MKTGTWRFGGISKENNFYYLFWALVLMLFSSALLQQFHTPAMDSLYDVIFILMLLIGVRSLETEKPWLYTIYTLAFLSFLIYLAQNHLDPLISVYFQIAVWLFFFIGSFMLSVKRIVLSERVDANMMIGAIVLYLLLGLIFSSIYIFILTLFPDAFNGIDFVHWQKDFPLITYYSFVTLTTLGYGDISPSAPIARFFVSAEAVVGVFYVAMIVSSLVSARLHTLEKERRRNREEES